MLARPILRSMAILFLSASLVPFASLAHPHAWIETKTTFHMDDSGMLTAIDQTWRFDDFYTILLIQDAQNSNIQRMSQLGGYLVHRLKTHHYFIHATAGHKRLALRPVTRYNAKVQDGRLLLWFRATLKKPINPKSTPFLFQVYDPTYYIDIENVAGLPPRIQSTAPTSCRAVLHKAHPGDRALERAQAVDRTLQEDHTLGLLFADKITIRCKTK